MPLLLFFSLLGANLSYKSSFFAYKYPIKYAIILHYQDLRHSRVSGYPPVVLVLALKLHLPVLDEVHQETQDESSVTADQNSLPLGGWLPDAIPIVQFYAQLL